MRPVAVLLSACALAAAAFAADAAALNDGVDRSDPDFVKASLVVIGPGNEFFGCAGHSGLRLECPKFKLDYCFSCESESVRENPVRFVMGNLKMGMYAIPTAKFLAYYEKLERRATQYPLNLPPDVKQRLWKILDDQVGRGTCLHYDYIRFCCVQTVLTPLLEAIKPHEIVFAPWPEKYRKTRRELLAENLAWCPWTRFALHTIAGTAVDEKVSPVKTVILSPDLLEALRGARVAGQPVVTGAGEVLLPNQRITERGWFTPMATACLLLAVAIGYWWFPTKGVAWAFLAFQSALGLLLTHLLLVSNLPATSWNWLIVPFNPLPLVFWKWRRRWALAFAAVLLVWVAGMALCPHQLTDSAYLVIVLAYAVFYAKCWLTGRASGERDGTDVGRAENGRAENGRAAVGRAENGRADSPSPPPYRACRGARSAPPTQPPYRAWRGARSAPPTQGAVSRVAGRPECAPYPAAVRTAGAVYAADEFSV